MLDEGALAREAEAFARKRRKIASLVIAERAGGRVLMVRFTRRARAISAISAVVLAAMVLGLPWVIPFNNEPGVSESSVRLGAAVVLALVFGPILLPLLITGIRGGFLALAETGVLIQTGLSSVLIPWSAIGSALASTLEVDGKKYANPVMCLSFRGDFNVPGWPRRLALWPVLLPSWRPLQIAALWFEPVPVDRMAAIVGHLASHPENRSKIGDVDPGEWIDAPPAARGRDTPVP